MSSDALFGFINIDKPKGMTSHDVVAVLRRITKIRQIGHTGTLDPFATGVLPVCIGKATRLIEFLEDDKAYLATVQFGKNTETYDIEGKVTETFNKIVDRADIESALNDFRGEIEQIPPIYSAIKVNGKKLYEYARKGENVEIKPRKVTINKLELVSFDEETQIAQLAVQCSKGTYIRSIAYDLGKKLACGGYLTGLIRTQAGKFVLPDALNLEDLTKEKVAENIVNPVKMLPFEHLEVTDDELSKIKNGVAILRENVENNKFVTLTYQNNICAIGFSVDNKISLKKVFA